MKIPKHPLVKSSTSGRVSNDGNPMIGGTYAFSTCLAHAEIEISRLLSVLNPKTNADAVLEWMKQNYDKDGIITIEAYITSGYDHSVGVNGYCELDEYFDPDDFYAAMDDCPLLTGDEYNAVADLLQNTLEEMDIDNYTLYEAD